MTEPRRVLIDWEVLCDGIYWVPTNEERETPLPQRFDLEKVQRPGKPPIPRPWPERLSEQLLRDLKAWNDSWGDQGPPAWRPSGCCKSGGGSLRSGSRTNWGPTTGKCSTTRVAGCTECIHQAVGLPKLGNRSCSATRRVAAGGSRGRGPDPDSGCMQGGQQVVYVPGRTVSRMAGAFAGEGKTDAKDAQVIADTARMRADFRPLTASAERVSELGLLTGYRRDLVKHRVQMVNRLRELLVGICPALEREFEYRSRPGLVLLTGFQTPAALRRIGARRLAGWLARRNVRSAADIAERAVRAAHTQRTRLPGEARAARLVADLASRILELDDRITGIDAESTQVLADDEQAQIIQSLPGMGPLLTAEFIAVTAAWPVIAMRGTWRPTPGSRQ